MGEFELWVIGLLVSVYVLAAFMGADRREYSGPTPFWVRRAALLNIPLALFAAYVAAQRGWVNLLVAIAPMTTLAACVVLWRRRHRVVQERGLG